MFKVCWDSSTYKRTQGVPPFTIFPHCRLLAWARPLSSRFAISRAIFLGWWAPPGVDDLILPFVAAGEPWRSTNTDQLREEEEDTITSLLGAMPVVEDCQERIPCAATSFYAKNLPPSCLIAPARPAPTRFPMTPPLEPVHHRLYQLEHRGSFIWRWATEIRI
jgi:hypothetical protein